MSSLVFPMSLPGITIAFRRRPIYATKIQTASSGKELRAAFQIFPRYRYNLSFEFLRSDAVFTELQTLQGLFSRHLGQWDSFLIADPEDYTVTAHPFGRGNAVATAFQLQRSIVPSAQLPADVSKTFYPGTGDGFEPVFDVQAAPQIYVGGVLKATPADYTISASGLVTFTAAPANNAILTWTGTFYRRARFASDEMESERMFVQIWEQKSLDLISVK